MGQCGLTTKFSEIFLLSSVPDPLPFSPLVDPVSRSRLDPSTILVSIVGGCTKLQVPRSVQESVRWKNTERVSPIEYYRDNTGSYRLPWISSAGARRSNRIKATIRKSSRLPSNAGVRPLEYSIAKPATNEPFERSRIKTRGERTNEQRNNQKSQKSVF